MKKKLQKILRQLLTIKRSTISPAVILLVANLAIVFFQLIYTNLRFSYLNTVIPFFYTKPWGGLQLTNKSNIFYIPAMALAVTLGGIFFSYYTKKLYFKFGDLIILFATLFCNILLTYSLLRIIKIASTPFEPLINPTFLPLVIPFVVAFFVVYIITPRFIKWAKARDLVTDPSRHSHPAMILEKASARGGGVVFTLGLLITTLLFVNVTKNIMGVALAATLLALLGLADDYQNTHPKSVLKILEAPYVRLTLLALVAFIITLFRIKIGPINNPFNGVLELEVYTVTIGGLTIGIVSTIITTLWIVWILNLLSWSNGIDGQYCGIIGIVGIIIAVLALRFSELTPEHYAYAKLAIIVSGASLGLAPYSWHPSKIMWGFGAMAAGICIATLSILVNSKITTSIIILMIPFLDASITLIRRIVSGKNPLKGDREHLHHLLLDMGWSVPKIALFYWGTTALFGLIGILSADKPTLQTVFVFVGVGAFITVLANLKSPAKKLLSRGLEK